MNVTLSNSTAGKGARGGMALFFLLTATRTLQAQEQVLAPPPAYSLVPPAMQEYETNQPGAPQLESLAAGAEEMGPPRWTQWGPVTVHPHFIYRFIYGNGIQSTPGEQQNTAIQQFSPGVFFALGTHWTLDYSPMFSFYSSSSFQNTIDQNVVLNWGTTYQDWVLGFSQGYSLVTAPLVQTGTQTETESYTTSAKASYRFNSKISVDASINQNFAFSPPFTSTRGWSTLEWLNYSWGDKGDVGIGAGYEYDDVTPGPNMMDEIVQGRVRWQFTQKLGFTLHGGLEDQQYLGGGASSLITPVFGVSVQYHPFTTTTLSLTADRSVNPSLFEGQVSESSSVGLTLNQQLLKRLNLTVGGSYGRTSYLSTTNDPTTGAGRVDNYYSLNVRLGTTLLERGTAAIFYQYSDNPSSIAAFSFTSSQVGLELGYRF